MTSKRLPAQDDPPSAATDDDDDDDDDDDETEDEQEQEIITQKTIQQSSSESEESEEEESESEEQTLPLEKNPLIQNPNSKSFEDEEESESEEHTIPPEKTPQIQNPKTQNPQIQNPNSKSSEESESESEEEESESEKQTLPPEKTPQIQNPNSKSSEDDEEESESESEEQTLPPEKTPQIQNPNSKSSEDNEEEESEYEEQTPPPGKKPQIQNPNSKSSEESESESEEETQTQKQTQTPKSSSIFDIESDIKSPSVSNLAIKLSKKNNTFSIPEKKQVLKRPSLNPDLKNKKKAKVSNGDENKSAVIKRIWSEEDELMILQGFIDYQSKKGYSPLSDMDDYYKFTMDSLPGNASKSQLYEKVRRLKKKFRVNEEKVSSNGEDHVFVKPHERKLFEVSNKIWGINGCETVGNVNGLSAKTKARSVKPKPKAEVKVDAKVGKAAEVIGDEIKDFETLYPYWNAGLNSGVSSYLNFPRSIVDLFRKDLSLIDKATAKEMDEKWKAHFEDEVRLQKRKFALLSKVSDMKIM